MANNSQIQVRSKPTGLREIARSNKMRQMVRAEALKIANRAGGEEDYAVESDIGKTRARAAVITATRKSMYRESRDHKLLRSVT